MHLEHITRETGYTRRASLREFSDHILDELYPLLRQALSSAGPYATCQHPAGRRRIVAP